jgi:antitoxin HicB
MRTYTVIVHEEEEGDGGGYWAEVQELPGCTASGDTLDELEKDVRDAIDQHLSALLELGKPIPEGQKAIGSERHWLIPVA